METTVLATSAISPVSPAPPSEPGRSAGEAPSAETPAGEGERPRRHWVVRLMIYLLYAVIAIVCVYILRHYLFTLNRLFGRQRHPYLDVDTADWPKVTVLIPAHNEEDVIGDLLQALLEADYDKEKLRILPINDRSEDGTKEIIEEFARRHPELITPFHRSEGKPGKAAEYRGSLKKNEIKK